MKFETKRNSIGIGMQDKTKISLPKEEVNNMKKKIASILLVLSAVAALCTGCGKDADDAVRYMNKTYGKKFGDEFKIKSASYRGLFGNMSKADNFLMTSERFPGFYIRVCYFEKEYTTDYMEMNFYEQYQDYMQPIFEEIFGECKVLLDFNGYPSVVYTEDTTFEEFLKTERTLKELYVFIENEEGMQEKVLTLLEELKERETPLGSVRFYVLKNYEDAKAFQSENDWGKYKDEVDRENIIKFYNYSFNREYEIRDQREKDYNDF